LPKTEVHAIVSGMTKPIETLTQAQRPKPPIRRQTKKMPRGSAQPFEMARFEQGNPRKSKLFFLDFLCPALPGFAGFG
jgi:hypothetical protein